MKLRTRTGHDGKWDGVREWKGSASFWRRFLGVKRGERVKTEGASGLFFTERATRDECEDGEVGRGGPPKKHGKTGILKKWVRQHL